VSETVHRILQVQQHWVDRLATWFADQCSPILVKEARQAMKSWHFQGTFLLLLFAVVAWSFLGISTNSFGDEREETGPTLLLGYMLILGFPLAVVLPLASFRSLAREFDDDTIQLLSITTLNARRIVLGKLGSAALQMAVYLSAVVPCVAFSYLLRGLDLSVIIVLLAIAIVGSLSLCCIGLMLAGFARMNWLAIMLNLALVVLLLFAYFLWCGLNFDLSRGRWSADVFGGNAMVTAFIAGAGYVAFECAASLISFPSEDRSSRVRWAISLHVLLVAVATTAWSFGSESGYRFRFESLVFGLSTFVSHYFCLVGAFMVGERSELSPRVRRGLPKTLLGRVLQGLYAPGPGRGYLFAVSGILGWNLAIFLAVIAGATSYNFPANGSSSGPSLMPIRLPMDALNNVPLEYLLPLLINSIFGIFYLSVVYLLMLGVGHQIKIGRVLAGAVVLVLMYVTMAIVCTSIDAFFFSSVGWQGVAQRWNWPVVLSRLNTMTDGFADTAIVGSVIATALFMLSCVAAIREWVVAPAMVPQRVLEETKRLRSAQTQSASPLE
jgi:hypothetical protein